jgi:NADH dehydrogenase FAD-containing subunit
MAQPGIISVGGGFNGLAVAKAKALKNAPAGILLMDGENHHLFQPLLYQVATSVLAPNQFGFPIPRGFSRHCQAVSRISKQHDRGSEWPSK